jgi:hypothetical protein
MKEQSFGVRVSCLLLCLIWFSPYAGFCSPSAMDDVKVVVGSGFLSNQGRAYTKGSRNYFDTCFQTKQYGSICSYPDLTPCVDRDGDGVPFCKGQSATGTGIPLWASDDIDPQFHLAPRSWSTPLTGVDFISFKECRSPISSDIPPNGYGLAVPYMDCSLSSPLPQSKQALDCNDSSPSIKTVYDYNTAPIAQILSVSRVLNLETMISYDSYEAMRDHPPKGFNPLDTLVVVIKTDPCVSSLKVKARIKPFSMGALPLSDIQFIAPPKNPEWLANLGLDPEKAPYLLSPGTLVGVINRRWFDDSPPVSQSDITAVDRKSYIGMSRLEQFLSFATTRFAMNLELGRDTNVVEASIRLPVDLCIPIWGNGGQKIVTSRGRTLNNQKYPNFEMRPIKSAQFVVNDVLRIYSPFKHLLDKFSVYADLSFLLTERKLEGTTGDDIFLDTFVRHSRCGGEIIQLAESQMVSRAYTVMKEGLVFIDNRFLTHPAEFVRIMYAHELGHAIGLLEDEYVAEVLETSPDDERTTLKLAELIEQGVVGNKNCAGRDEVKMRFPIPLNQLAPYDKRNSCTLEGIYRSTDNSMMNYSFTEQRFNTISCAYLLRRFLGGNPSDYFETCNSDSYETVKN